ncbi:MAG: hypothetical protein ACOYT4_02935 [Nanoarchaeota archaeon]
MVLIYHGTNLQKGLLIAEDKAILSNYQIKLKELKKTNKNYEQEFQMSIEDLALFLASSTYAEREIEMRVKRFSITTDFKIALGHANDYENYHGGLILGIETDEQYLSKLLRHSLNLSIFFVEDSLSLERLNEIHISPKAMGSFNLITDKFKNFNPKYLPIIK